jgi:hypothetical protein
LLSPTRKSLKPNLRPVSGMEKLPVSGAEIFKFSDITRKSGVRTPDNCF